MLARFDKRRQAIERDQVQQNMLICLQVIVRFLDVSLAGSKPATRVICFISSQLGYGATREMHATD